MIFWKNWFSPLYSHLYIGMYHLKSDLIKDSGCNGDVKIVNLYGLQAHSNVWLYNSCSINTTRE